MAMAMVQVVTFPLFQDQTQLVLGSQVILFWLVEPTQVEVLVEMLQSYLATALLQMQET
jgi:hypothetical protein